MRPGLPSLLDQLMLEARSGSSEVVDRLCPLIEDIIRPWAQRLTRNSPQVLIEADDLVQEVLIKVLQGLRQYQGNSPSQLMSWLKSILDNTWRDLLRRHRRMARNATSVERTRFEIDRQLSHATRETVPEVEAMQAEEATLFLLTVLLLPHPDGDVVLLRYVDDLGFEEIGQRLNCSPDAARMRYHRVIDQVAAFWRDPP